MTSLLNLLAKFTPLRKLHEKEDENEVNLSLETLVLSILLVCYIISGPLLKRFHIKIIRPSGVVMIIAILLTLLNKLMNPNSNFFKGFQFNHSFFFTFVLPIIIFSSAYNSKIESILKYLKYILLFSIPGTIISCIFIFIVTYYLNNCQFFTTKIISEDDSLIKYESINLSFREIIQFSVAISAIDSVTSLSFLMEDNEPKLNAISLGDSILNNAVVISIYNSILDIFSEKEKSVGINLTFKILFKSIIIFIFSLIIGVAVGIFHALFLVYLKKFRLDRVQEISTMLLFAFISYTLCDWLNLSSMTSLLACGLCMSHYMFYNLNYQTREESCLISLSLNLIAEGLIFSSMGMTILYYTLHSFSVKFIITEFILIVLCRIFTIFGQIYLLELMGINPQTFRLKTNHKSFLTNTGSIRGVVSFGLSLLMITPNENHKNLLVGSTIYIVFLTNIICILISPTFKRREKVLYDKDIFELDTSDDKVLKHDIYTFIHPNTYIIKQKPKKNKNLEKIKEEQNNLINKFIEYDNKVILPKIVLNWPDVKEDNNKLSRKIKRALGIWAEEKAKYNTYKENDTIQFNLPGFSNINSNDNNNENDNDFYNQNDGSEDDNMEDINYKKFMKRMELKEIVTNKDEE